VLPTVSPMADFIVCFLSNTPTTPSFILVTQLMDRVCVLYASTADVRQWYLQNGLQPNPDKSRGSIISIASGTKCVHRCVLL